MNHRLFQSPFPFSLFLSSLIALLFSPLCAPRLPAQASTTFPIVIKAPLMRYGEGFINQTVVSENGKIIATAGTLGIVLWNAKTGKKIRILSEPGVSYWSVALSEDGKQVWSTGDQGLTSWDGNLGRSSKTAGDQLANATTVIASPDGSRILLNDRDHFVLRDPSGGFEAILPIPQNYSADTGDFSHDGKFVVTVSNFINSKDQSVSSEIALWNARDGKRIRQMGTAGTAGTGSEHTDFVWTAAFSPGGKAILTGAGGLMGGDDTARLWETDTGTLLRIFQGSRGIQPELILSGIISVGFSPDGSKILTGTNNNLAVVWNTAQGNVLHVFRDLPGPVMSVAYSNNGSRIFTEVSGGGTFIWNADTYAPVQNISKMLQLTNSLAFSPNGKHFLSGNQDGSAVLWNAARGEKVRTFDGHTSSVLSVAFSHDAKSVLTGGLDGTALLYAVDEANQDPTSYDHPAAVTAVAFSPDGKSFSTGDLTGSLRIWYTEEGRKNLVLDAHSGAVNSVSYSPDGQLIVTASQDGSAKLWFADTGRLLRTYAYHAGAVTSAAVAPGNGLVATCGEDRLALLWKTTGYEPLRKFEGHDDVVNTVAFSSDGTALLTASDDKTAKLWNVETGQELRSFEGHTTAVTSAVFSPGGRRVLTGGSDGIAFLWPSGLLSVNPFRAVPVGGQQPAQRRAFSPSKRLTQKLLLVAGGGPFAGNAISSQTKALANYTLGAATVSGYLEENIRYLTDFDTTATQPTVYGVPSLSLVEDSIVNWADDAVQLTIVLIDHGILEPGPPESWHFMLDGVTSPTAMLTAAALDGFLDAAQSGDDPLPEVHLIIDTCFSGGFVQKCAGTPSPLLYRTVIASTTPRRLANFGASSGSLSFLFFFMSHARDNQNSFFDCFNLSREVIVALNSPESAPQLPWLDDDGDGVPTAADGLVADQVAFGSMPAFNLNLPKILDAREDATVFGNQDVDLWCDVDSPVDPERVEVFVTYDDPDHPEGAPITEIPEVHLAREGTTNRWSGTLSGSIFIGLGNYSLFYTALRDDGLGVVLAGVPLTRIVRLALPASTDRDAWWLYE